MAAKFVAWLKVCVLLRSQVIRYLNKDKLTMQYANDWQGLKDLFFIYAASHKLLSSQFIRCKG